LLSSADLSDEEIAVVGILREVVRIDVLNHLLIDAPIEITGKIIKSAAEMARLFGAQDISVALDKFEKETVKMAVDYGMKVLFQNEIRVTPGAIAFKYISQKGGEKEVVFQYLIIYQPLDANRGKVEIRFYSSNYIESPERKQSIGFAKGIYHDLQHDLPPFITEISGEVEKTDLGSYHWAKGPSIKITFPGSVPDLGIKPLSAWEKYLLKPLETAIKEIEIIITKATGKSLGLVEIWNEIKSFLSKINPFSPAAVVETQLIEGEPETDELEIEGLLVETGEKVSEEPEAEPELTDGEVQEILDSISEEIEANNEEVEEKEEEIEEVGEPEEEEAQITVCEIISGTSAVRNKIIINEVAWMGTISSASDEWIELKNLSGGQINLAGWQLLDKEKQIKTVFEEGIIPAGGFYLLERADDDSVPNMAADFIYTGGLSNTEEALYLFDENCQLQDEVVANPDWPAGDSSSKRTMERKSSLGWQTSSEAGGTPKRENSEGYYEYQDSSYSPPPPPSDTELPIANAGLDQTAEIKETIIFDASGSTDNVGIVSYQWDIDDDGEFDLIGVNPNLAEGYSEVGEYLTTLKVTDAAGNAATDTLTITVLPPPKILITEVQIAVEGDEKEEFVELYNPNQTDVNLTDWYIQRKTSPTSDYSTFAPGTLFSGKTIGAKDYFLIARQGSSFVNLADIITDYPLTENNTLVLKNQNRVMIDEVSWGEISAGLSYGRKWEETAQEYLDVFEIQLPTPKAKNQPLPPEEPSPEFSFQSAAGYNDPEEQWEDEELAYDGDTNTYARVHVASIDTSWLELFAPSGKLTQAIRFWGSGGPLQIDIYYDGNWYSLKNWAWGISSAPANEWVELTYPSETSETVEKARIKFHGRVSRGWSCLNEFQFKTSQ
jgi:PKD repeat protein